MDLPPSPRQKPLYFSQDSCTNVAVLPVQQAERSRHGGSVVEAIPSHRPVQSGHPSFGTAWANSGKTKQAV